LRLNLPQIKNKTKKAPGFDPDAFGFNKINFVKKKSMPARWRTVIHWVFHFLDFWQ
jgi:hypothetical protein